MCCALYVVVSLDGLMRLWSMGSKCFWSERRTGKEEISGFKKEWMELWALSWAGTGGGSGGWGHKNLQMKWLCSMRAPFPHGVIIWKVQTYTSSQWGFPRSEPKELEPIFSCSSTVLTALNKKQLSKCPGHAGLNLILAAHQGKNAGVGALCSQHSTKSSCYNEMFVRHRRLNGSQYH